MSVYEECQARATLKGGHGHLQWKGTEAALDFTCDCGAVHRFDGMFLIFVRCPTCDAIYWLNPTIEAVRLTREESADVQDEGWEPKDPITA